MDALSPVRVQGHSAWQGVALIALSAAAFGVMPIFARVAYANGADVYGLLLTRFAVAFVLLLGCVRVLRVRMPSLRRTLVLAAMGGIGYVGQSFCYFVGLRYAPASLIALLLYLYPCFVTLLAVAFLRERLSWVGIGALLLCSLGCVLTVGAAGGTGARPLGMALGIGAAVVYSIYIVIGARATAGVDARATTTVVCGAATLVLALICIARQVAGHGPRWSVGAAGWLAMGGIGVLSTVVAILAFFAGLQRLGAARAAMLSTLEPVVTVLLAALWLGERLTPLQGVGGVLILAGVLWLSARDRPVPTTVA